MKVRASVKPICDKCKVIRRATEVIGGQDGTYSRC